MKRIIIAAMFAAIGAGCAGAQPVPASRLATDAQIDAAQAAPVEGFAKEGRWNEPFAPFTIAGNLHYVGTATVSAFLITTPDGHVLIDGVLAQSVPQIIGNIKALGFDIADVKYLLNTHAHIDHAGGLAGLQRASGAQMLASAADKPFLEAGAIDHGPSQGMRFPPVRVDRLIGDGDVIALGGAALTAHLTPGHSPGCTSWSLPVKAADGTQRQAFLHCSATVAGQSLVPEAYPGMVAAFRGTFAKVKGIRADIFLANHDNFFALADKRRRQIAGDANAFVNPDELQGFNSRMEAQFEGDLKQQAAKR
ncbi:subclass B3 metallo-beta-lactamase [Sphingomonas sp. 35-24ZXX]|uniref:subclass B3 metallo-beta-lactamase n=1 Tax=Sphingomonas sp. 35-24ZXX TaxID=1545915 RepID=UPI00053BE7A2|nr:subclass B3 metallo-beta-lactamase [Sphingomonas sp. 35-24ZXX]